VKDNAITWGGLGIDSFSMSQEVSRGHSIRQLAVKDQTLNVFNSIGMVTDVHGSTLVCPSPTLSETKNNLVVIEQILSRENMKTALNKVVSNKGAAGVDGMSVHELALYVRTHWASCRNQVLENHYLPKAIKGVYIPKPNGKKRLLGIPSVVDRLLQQAVSQQLSQIYEPHFQEHSYGFRPHRNAHQAVLQAQANINDGYQDIVDIDLSNFFDEVRHDVLLNLLYQKVKCQQTLCLIRRWLKAPMQLNGKLVKRTKGVPQGSPISPLLSNILLNELDKELERRGHRWVRYADDFSIYVKSKSAAKRVGNSIYKFLGKRLYLPINRSKSGLRRPVSFTILGYGFVPTYRKGEKGQYQLVASKKALVRFKQAAKALTRKTIPMSFDERIHRLKLLQTGWVNYFKLANMHGKLKKLDEWLRNRLRYCIWHHWKRPERKRKNLIRLGVPHGQAYAWSRTRMGGWAVACSPMLRTTITLARLEKRKYVSLLDHYLRVSLV
jgi:RNA-directed DNA polymerase